MPFAYFVFANSYIRRKFFEWFYIIHIYSAILITTIILWHASQGWRYLMPCLMLYVLDRCIRFYKSTNMARVDSLETIRMGKVGAGNEYVVTKLGLSVATLDATKGGDGEIATRAFYGNMRHKMGQYAFINIPMISPLEWHPFTISSGPYQRQTTFHIKVKLMVWFFFLYEKSLFGLIINELTYILYSLKERMNLQGELVS